MGFSFLHVFDEESQKSFFSPSQSSWFGSQGAPAPSFAHAPWSHAKKAPHGWLALQDAPRTPGFTHRSGEPTQKSCASQTVPPSLPEKEFWQGSPSAARDMHRPHHEIPPEQTPVVHWRPSTQGSPGLCVPSWAGHAAVGDQRSLQSNAGIAAAQRSSASTSNTAPGKSSASMHASASRCAHASTDG